MAVTAGTVPTPPAGRQSTAVCKHLFMPSGPRRITRGLELLEQPIATAEFLVVDTETNGLGGDACELTEVGAVLVGGGELHDRWSSLVRTSAPLRRGIQRFTGITQAMVDGAPSLEDGAAGAWRAVTRARDGRPQRAVRPPRAAPGVRADRPRVAGPAGALHGGAGAQRCCRCSASAGSARSPMRSGSRSSRTPRAGRRRDLRARAVRAVPAAVRERGRRSPTRSRCCTPRRPTSAPAAPHDRPAGRGGCRSSISASCRATRACTCSATTPGATLYVGKSISIRSRARAHFAPSTAPAQWTAHASVVDYRATRSELGALVLENRLIKQLRPPGNVRLTRRDDRLVYIRCRLDIPFPILEVAAEPAAGHAVTIGPLRGRRLAESSSSSSTRCSGCATAGGGCRDASTRRPTGRWVAACRRAWATSIRICIGAGSIRRWGCSSTATARELLLAHVEAQMREAAAERAYERAAWLRRRCAAAAATILERLGRRARGDPRAAAAGARRAPGASRSARRVLAGRRPARRLGPLPATLRSCGATGAALARGGRAGELGAHVPPAEIDEVRIVATYLAWHPEVAAAQLDPPPGPSAPRPRGSAEGQLDDLSLDPSPRDRVAGLRLATDQGERDRAEPGRDRGAADVPDSAVAELQLIARVRSGADERRPRRWRLGLPR